MIGDIRVEPRPGHFVLFIRRPYREGKEVDVPFAHVRAMPSGLRSSEGPPEMVSVEDAARYAAMFAAAPMLVALADRIIAMDGDDYLAGHPEWSAIVERARDCMVKADGLPKGGSDA